LQLQRRFATGRFIYPTKIIWNLVQFATQTEQHPRDEGSANPQGGAEKRAETDLQAMNLAGNS
jgi:hypothetical protein